MQPGVELEIKVPVTIKKKGKYYIVSCKPLDLYDQGETAEIAKRNIKCAMEAFFISCIERDVLLDVLEECGLIPAKKPAFIKTRLPKEPEYINIPLHLLAQHKQDSLCHV